jgi:hypothetical protein
VLAPLFGDTGVDAGRGMDPVDIGGTGGAGGGMEPAEAGANVLDPVGSVFVFHSKHTCRCK